MNWNELLFGQEGASFLFEIGFRTVVMFLVVVVSLSFTGRRGVKQLSVFEMVMIISLGSAAGDPMFYKEVGLLQAAVVFLVVLLFYRLIIYFISRYDNIEFLFEGKPLLIILDGKFTEPSVNTKQLGSDELFSELRNMNIEHLGQLKRVLLETDGSLSILYFKEEEVIPGLPIWPENYERKSNVITLPGLHSCSKCGYTESISPTSDYPCRVCKNLKWVEPLDCTRIT